MLIRDTYDPANPEKCPFVGIINCKSSCGGPLSLDAQPITEEYGKDLGIKEEDKVIGKYCPLSNAGVVYILNEAGIQITSISLGYTDLLEIYCENED